MSYRSSGRALQYSVFFPGISFVGQQSGTNLLADDKINFQFWKKRSSRILGKM